MQKPIILVSGSLAYDYIMDFPGRFRDHILPDKIHILSVSFKIDRIEERFGGTAGNIAYSLKLLGTEPIILSKAGRDFERYKDHLEKLKIDTSRIRILKNEKTAAAYIITDQDDNQITAFYPGALKSRLALDSLPSNCAMAIAAPDNKDTMISRVTQFQNKKLCYIFDPGQMIPTFTALELLKCIRGSEVLIGNDYEISLIRHKTRLKENEILKFTKILVKTLGPKGSIIKTSNKSYKISAIKPKKLVDPTGTGDAYRAGFIYGFLQGYPLEKVGRIASLVASYPIQYYGTQEHAIPRQKY
jgi:adenosine kinase